MVASSQAGCQPSSRLVHTCVIAAHRPSRYIAPSQYVDEEGVNLDMVATDLQDWVQRMIRRGILGKVRPVLIAHRHTHGHCTPSYPWSLHARLGTSMANFCHGMQLHSPSVNFIPVC